jgi:hypothetical protein
MHRMGPARRAAVPDDFSGPLTGYVAEYARKPGNAVESRDGRLLIDVDSGATVWLDKPLSGNVADQLHAARRGRRREERPPVRLQPCSGWRATRASANLFTRSGKFEDYDDLALYYAGIGGNTQYDHAPSALRRRASGR